MTQEQQQQQQQRIKIAEVRGFYEEEPWLDGRPCWGHKDHPKYIGFEEIPDYLYDLNAMHDAESALNLSQWDTYEAHLKAITAQAGIYSPIRATAAQRAEAFLRTLSLWTEE